MDYTLAFHSTLQVRLRLESQPAILAKTKYELTELLKKTLIRQGGKVERSRASLVQETVGVFLRLGCTSFGGPAAHLGYFQNELVQRRRWLSDAEYADVVALCQFLPGPASSQVCLVLGYLHSGLLGGMLGWMAFTAPSAILMIGFAYGVHLFDVQTAGWILGLKVAAVAVVAQAIWIMTRRLCPDSIRFAIMLMCSAALIFFRAAWMQPLLIAAGALAGLVSLRNKVKPRPGSDNFAQRLHLSRVMATISLALFAALLAFSLAWPGRGIWADDFARFFRTGSLVFGGGHVVLPLLQAETVQSGLVSHDVFLAGYGAAQALPGPLFTFAAFLGASMASAYPPWILGLWCLAAILLPSLLLILGTLPFWARLINNVRVQAAFKGANAAVVGLLVAAFYDPVWKNGILSWSALVLAVIAFVLLQWGKAPNWSVVMACGFVGEWIL
jgi:chromate transporter